MVFVIDYKRAPDLTDTSHVMKKKQAASTSFINTAALSHWSNQIRLSIEQSVTKHIFQ